MQVLGPSTGLGTSATASDGGALTHQQVIDGVLKLYAEFGAVSPTPSLIGAWKKRICAGNGARLLELLAELALKGGLEKGVPYVATVLRSEEERAWRENQRCPTRRQLEVGDLSLNQNWRWNGVDWDPVGKPPGGSGE